MAWVTPPTFADDVAASSNATNLNILKDDAEYLNDQQRTIQLPFWRLGGASGVPSQSLFRHHAQRYLKIRVTWDKGTDPGANFTLTVKWEGSGGTTVISESLGGTTPTTQTFTADLDTLVSPTVGTLYEIHIAAATNSYAGTYLFVDVLYEDAVA